MLIAKEPLNSSSMHRKTLQELYSEFKTSDRGLTNQEATTRLERHGPNIIEERKKKSLIVSFLEEFTDLMVVILIIAALIAAASGEPRDGGVILFIVILNATIGFIQKYKAEKALEALRKMLSPQAKVLRNGTMVEIPASQVVPGDILLLGEGDKIAADGRLIEENELEVDESSLTGESIPVTKNIVPIEKENLEIHECENRVFMGTAVTHGTAKALVIYTGMETEFGKIAHLTQATRKDKSPLQKELFKIGIFVGKVTLGISTILLLIGWLWQNKPFTETFLFATSVAVAAVPEGLPATVTIALAIGVQRLAKKNSIVKKLASVETLGATTVICSDKTGTLTKNEMTVVEAYFDDQPVSIEGRGYDPHGTWEKVKPSMTMEKLTAIATLCNNSKLQQKNNQWGIIGDPTEGALLVASNKTPYKPIQWIKAFKRIQELPFDSIRKMMTTIDQNKKTGEVHAHLKGAPDEVLKICTHYYKNGKVLKLTTAQRKIIAAHNEAMAKKALRVLAFAERPLGENNAKKDEKYNKALVEQNMIFVGLFGMIDPPRPEVYSAVEMAQNAGIKIYMITGDYGPTAVAIGRDLKIVQGNNVEIIAGAQLNKMNDKKLAQIFEDKKRQVVFARVSPEHKLKIVNALKKNGEIVAMTGDGVNDAPALKKADIGVAMGITGTDVSKEAADMVLVDDSFGTIVISIEEGRNIYSNLKKFVFYIFSCNIGELMTVFTAILLGLPQPLTAILILAVDLGTDVLPAIAIGVEPGEADLMKKPPRSQSEHIMKKNFVVHFLYLGLTIGIIVVSMYFWMLHQYGWSWGEPLNNETTTYLKASTAAFTLLVFIQMMNALNVRNSIQSIFKIGLFKNRWLVGAITLSIVTVIAFVEVPFFQSFLHTTNLTLEEWILLAIASISVFVIEETRKLIFRSAHKT